MADAKAGTGNAIVGMGRGSYVVLLAFFLGPAVVIYTVFSIYPLFATIFNSLYLRQPDGAYLFNGLGNFQTLLTDTTTKPTGDNPHYFSAFRFSIMPASIAAPYQAIATISTIVGTRCLRTCRAKAGVQPFL